MNSRSLLSTLGAGVLLCPALPAQVAQSSSPAIWLEPSEPPSTASMPLKKGEASFANAPANFRAFPSARVGEEAYPERLTLRFSAATQLTKIESTKDFQIQPESNCGEQKFYSARDSCTLVFRFTPQGPGRRLGKVNITHTGSAEPLSLGLGGYGYAPVISFNPAVITTVPGTYPSNKGLLTSAQNLTVDGSDSLHIADTGNNGIRYIDSSGNITSLATGLSGPLGIAVDNFGEVYFSEPTANAMYTIWDYGLLVHLNGTGTAACTYSSPCSMSSEAMSLPGQMAMDINNHLFFAEGKLGAAISTVLPYPPNFAELYDPFTYQESQPDAFTVDGADNLYSYWDDGALCMIIQQSLYNAETSTQNYKKVIGGRTCGFSGRQAGNGEIGKVIGQMTFDIAGNLYFTDTSNQRVRRVDAVTGIINTIAGTGAAGYTGDFGPANQADLSSPTGVAVDSQGQVYIISGAAATGTAQVVRKVGTTGYLSFGSQLKGTASTAHQVTVSNTAIRP